MLDGRIDVHGTVKDLRSRGIIDDIAKQEALLRSESEVEAEAAAGVAETSTNDKARGTGHTEEVVATTVGRPIPRKLVKEEEREAGRVKWKIYNTYLKAS
jgi:hypothetical protein